jgi:hypothetical protein
LLIELLQSFEKPKLDNVESLKAKWKAEADCHPLLKLFNEGRML